MKASDLKLTIIVLISVMLTSCETTAPSYTVRVLGDHAFLENAADLFSDFELKHDSVAIQTVNEGNIGGISRLKNREVDIAVLGDQELADSLLGEAFESQIIAYDALVLAVNKSNVKKQLTNDQVRLLYSGKAGDWLDLGGAQQDVRVYGWGKEPAMLRVFSDYLTMEESEITFELVDERARLVDLIANEPGAVGLLGMGDYSANLQGVALYNEEKKVFVEPTYYKIVNGDYPLVRSVHVYYPNNASPQVQLFVDYLMSKQGQTQLSFAGLLPALIMI